VLGNIERRSVPEPRRREITADSGPAGACPRSPWRPCWRRASSSASRSLKATLVDCFPAETVGLTQSARVAERPGPVGSAPPLGRLGAVARVAPPRRRSARSGLLETLAGGTKINPGARTPRLFLLSGGPKFFESSLYPLTSWP
jgi:hypothetical protein